MKKQFATFLFLAIIQSLTAETFYDQLCSFNYNWKNYANRVPVEQYRTFKSDADFVRSHLDCVLEILIENPTIGLSQDQKASRLNLLHLLAEYRTEGRFPKNLNQSTRIPVFIDHEGTHCAVAFLLQQTGYESLALQIAEEDNFIRVKDIQSIALTQWQKSSGLTMEELKLIQGAYDFYPIDAFIAVNKYEIPQKPGNFTAYFEKGAQGKGASTNELKVWCKGEGKNGILHGRWEQNYSEEFPWIVGYFENNKRTGQWYEYYQGSNQLCRTENWRNDKLNGIRRRFSREGKLIEEILFKDGIAERKTNFNLQDNIFHVRIPLDSATVHCEVYSTTGSLLAVGNERIHNPGDLKWFQNIELTALNSAAISARDGNDMSITSSFRSQRELEFPTLYNTPALVQYFKVGDWMFYKENWEMITADESLSLFELLKRDYAYPSVNALQTMSIFNVKQVQGFDSLQVTFNNNAITDFFGFLPNGKRHYGISYYHEDEINRFPNINYLSIHPIHQIKQTGEFDQNNRRIGEWQSFDEQGILYKIERFILPEKQLSVVSK